MEVSGPHQLPAEKYPIVFKAFLIRTDELVFEKVIERPRNGRHAAVYIPPLATLHGGPIRIEIHFADGEVQRQVPAPD